MTSFITAMIAKYSFILVILVRGVVKIPLEVLIHLLCCEEAAFTILISPDTFIIMVIICAFNSLTFFILWSIFNMIGKLII